MYSYHDSSATVITDIRGKLTGGATVLFDTLSDIEAFLVLCIECREKGLNAVLGWMSRFDEWLRWLGDRRRPTMEPERDFQINRYDKHPDNLSDMERMILALHIAREIWLKTPENEISGLRVVVSVSTGNSLRYEGELPALYFHEGSLDVAFTPFTDVLGPTGMFSLALGAFGVGLLYLPSIAAEGLVEDLRKAATFAHDVPRLDKLEKEHFEGKDGVIILLHGLLSTDLGTFDGLLEALWGEQLFSDYLVEDTTRRLRLESLYKESATKRKMDTPSSEEFCSGYTNAIKKDYLVVGWPHDTLTEIDNNADALFEEIVIKIGPDGPPIIFVCHSRGGLVARKTALIDQSKARAVEAWRNKIKTCITFGTPHMGADLASHPLKFVAAYFVVMAGAKTFASLPRVLSIYLHRHGFPGIKDLIPASDGGTFLKSLREAERDNAQSAALRELEIFAVGSKYTGQRRLLRNVISGLLRTAEHDLVVRTNSTAPETIPDREITDCSHFEYFSKEETTKKDHVKKIIKRIWEVFNIESSVIRHTEHKP